MSTDLALVVGEGCPLFGGVYTICGVEDEDGGLSTNCEQVMHSVGS